MKINIKKKFYYVYTRCTIYLLSSLKNNSNVAIETLKSIYDLLYILNLKSLDIF